MSYPLDRPDPPATFSPADFANEVVLVIIGGHHPEVPTREYGVRPAERVTIVMLSGRTAGTVYEDVMLFGKTSTQFRDKDGGRVVLCRIVKSGRSTVFEPGSGYDEEQAKKWIGDNTDRLARLQAEAVDNFREQARKLAEGPGPIGLATSPQYGPPVDKMAEPVGVATFDQPGF